MNSKPPSKRVELLKDRNDKLSAQVAVQREQVNLLQRRLEEMEDKESTLQETVLCVNRLWEELNSSIGFISYRATDKLSLPSGENAEDTHAGLLEEVNPFLAKLLGSFVPSDAAANAAAKGLAGDLTDTETALRKRMADTMHAASRLLETVEAGRSAADGEMAEKSKEAQLAALNNLLRAENNRLRDLSLQDATKIKELQSALSDREEELLVAQRKVVQLKEGAGPGGMIAASQEQSLPGSQPAASADIKTDSNAAPTPPQSTAEDAAVAERLKRQLDRRAAEVEERDAALGKAEREIRDLRTKLTSERAAAARARQYEGDRAQHLTAELDHLDSRLRDAHRERDHLVARLQEASNAADQGIAASRRLAGAGAHVAELEGQLSAARAARAEAEGEIYRLRSATGNASTAEELGKLVKSLERDLATARQTTAKHKAAAEGLHLARTEAAGAARLVAEAEARAKAVQERLVAARAEASVHAQERERWAEREEELRLFAEVAQNFLGSGTGDGNSDGIEALHAQVAAFMAEQVAEVTSRLAANAPTIESLQKESAELRDRLEAEQGERAAIAARAEGLQQEAEALRLEAAALREESEAFMKEMESVTEAYETAREQNGRLLEKIVSRDEDNSRLMAEAAAATRERAAMVEERDAAAAATARAEGAAADASVRVAELEMRIKKLANELEAARTDARQLAARSDAAARDLAGAQAALAAASRDVEEALKEAAAARAERDAEAETARREKTRADRAERDAADLQGSVQRSQLPGSKDEVAAECVALRKMVNCNVCSARLKDRIITKCNHIFCSHCVEQNLQSRHRKCPGCGERFGANDVQTFYFT